MTMTSDRLSKAARAVWAKFGRHGETEGGWLPLYLHMSDTAAIARLVWHRWLPESTRHFIAMQIDADQKEAETLVCWLAAIHDLGKASPVFAMQVPELASRMSNCGLAFPRNEPLRIPHSIVSHFLILNWLVDTHGWQRAIAESYCVVPGGHHGTPPTEDALIEAKKRPSSTGAGETWASVHAELATYVTARVGAGVYLSTWSGKPLKKTTQGIITALVIMSDWLASDENLFPYERENESSEELAEAAWDTLRMPGPWAPTSTDETVDTRLRHRFQLPNNVQARPIQRAALECVDHAEGPALLIVEAPMGEGKTELALLAAESFAAQSGSGGVAFALPTMATSNALFSRIHSWVNALPDSPSGEHTKSVILAHAKARQNDEFRFLPRASNIVFSGDHNDGSADDVAAAYAWFSGRKKGMLANFVVGTIDQILFAALKTKHVVLRHLALVNKVVIIDEVHASDAYMSVYLRRVLNWLGAYHVPTLVMSATLDPEARLLLAAAYANKEVPEAHDNESFNSLRNESAYPLITTVTPTGAVAHARPEASNRSSTIRVFPLDDDDDSLIQELQTSLKEGGSVAIVRNTVGRAQHTAALLRAKIPNADVLLMHSRFLTVDRESKERELRTLLGPDAGHDEPVRFGERPLILVGTQVLEQSLDIDVDLMISDLAPIDLLLQRAGRLHRHDRTNRASGVRSPRLLIAGADWTTTPPQPHQHSAMIYQEYPLLAAAHVLQEHLLTGRPVSLPADIARLVRDGYDPEHAVEAEWHETWDTARHTWKKYIANKEAKAKDFLLSEPWGGSWMDALNAAAIDQEDSIGGQAQVRDTEDSVEVLIVQRLENDVRILPWLKKNGGRRIPTIAAPDEALAYSVLECSLRLPYQLCAPWRIDRVIGDLEHSGFAGWQSSPLLHGQLVLVLDTDLSAKIDGTPVCYDRDDGLLIGNKNTQ